MNLKKNWRGYKCSGCNKLWLTKAERFKCELRHKKGLGNNRVAKWRLCGY